jgi:hypothetical protein
VGWIRNLWEVIVPLSERRSFSRRKSDWIDMLSRLLYDCDVVYPCRCRLLETFSHDSVLENDMLLGYCRSDSLKSFFDCTLPETIVLTFRYLIRAPYILVSPCLGCFPFKIYVFHWNQEFNCSIFFSLLQMYSLWRGLSYCWPVSVTSIW